MATTPLPFPQEPAGPVGPAAPLPSGAAVAHLTIERVLHEGLHTIVYEARDAATGEALALMEYFPRALALRQPDGSVRARQAGDAIALSVGREAFVIDANTLERIDHPGIVRVLGSLQAHRTVYRAMRLIEGPTLEAHVAAHGPATSTGAVIRLLDALLDALRNLHNAGVVHGCVRPDQILLTNAGKPVLLGMGSAGAELVGHDAGPWSAPEQAAKSRHDRINSATDLYMVAATAWFYATGEEPPALRERLAKPNDWDPAIALAALDEDGERGSRACLVSALSAALALTPADRPQRVSDLRSLLHPAGAPAAFEHSGSAPLWVGVVPDRESQWETADQPDALVPRAASAPPPPKASVSPAATDLPFRRTQPPLAPFAATAEPRPVPTGGRGHIGWWAGLVLMVVIGLFGWWMWTGGQAPWQAPALLPPPAAVPAEPMAAASVAPAAAPVPGPASAPAAVALAPEASPSAPTPPVASAPVLERATEAPTPAPPAQAAARVPAPVGAPPAKAAAPMSAAPSPKPAVAARPAVRPSPRSICGNRSQFALLYCLQEQCERASQRNHAQCVELRRRGDIR